MPNGQNPRENVGGDIRCFFGALLLYLSARFIMQIWFVLLVAALIALAVIIYLRIKKGKPKY